MQNNSNLKIGLEIHGYLVTQEKLFCKCKNAHKDKEALSNSYICPICTGQPGSKPMLPNAEAIEKIIKISLILNCHVNHLPVKLIWWRKHYNWPDLPKGFQNTISGTYAIPVGEKGKFQEIRIKEVHLEEDPAAWNPEKGTIDYNRSGSPLVEIVTEPDFKSAEQVVLWLKQLILTLSYINAIDKDAGIKADVNVSLYGDRVEIKNINSITEIINAINYEALRQKKEKPLSRETRAWNSEEKLTVKMREKEAHADYRFIKDPDLPVIKITKQQVDFLRKKIPESPIQKLEKLIKKHKIKKQDAEILISNIDIIEFFEKIIESKKINLNIAVPWITTELTGVLNYNKKTLNEIEIKPEHFIKLLELLEQNKITKLKALDILRTWIPKSKPIILAENKQISDELEIKEIVERVIKKNKIAVEDFKKGKNDALNFLIGQVMNLTNKKADYKLTKEILLKKLK